MDKPDEMTKQILDLSSMNSKRRIPLRSACGRNSQRHTAVSCQQQLVEDCLWRWHLAIFCRLSRPASLSSEQLRSGPLTSPRLPATSSAGVSLVPLPTIPNPLQTKTRRTRGTRGVNHSSRFPRACSLGNQSLSAWTLVSDSRTQISTRWMTTISGRLVMLDLGVWSVVWSLKTRR